MAPVIYKTTDAGATWNQLPSFDWTAMPLMEEWMFATVDAGEYIPYFEQVSATVDVTGRLHIFSEVFSRYTSNYADSIMFIYSNSNVFCISAPAMERTGREKHWAILHWIRHLSVQLKFRTRLRYPEHLMAANFFFLLECK